MGKVVEETVAGGWVNGSCPLHSRCVARADCLLALMAECAVVSV